MLSTSPLIARLLKAPAGALVVQLRGSIGVPHALVSAMASRVWLVLLEIVSAGAIAAIARVGPQVHG